MPALTIERINHFSINSPAIIYSCSVAPPNFPATFISKNIERILGYQPSEFLSQEDFWISHIHPDDLENVIKHLPQLFEVGEHHHSYRFRAKSGKYKWFRDDLMLVKDEFGQPIEIIGNMVDISDEVNLVEEAARLRVAEALLLEQNARLDERNSLMQDMHDGFGSTLLTARMRLDGGTITKEELSQILIDTLADLHIICDLLASTDQSLGAALADFRYRVERRMELSDVKIHWCLCDLDEICFKPRTALNILRIIQEALSNALKHSKASNVFIDVTRISNEIVEFCISDDGLGLPMNHSNGRGLNNLFSRATKIQGKLTVSNRPVNGCCVKLLLKV